MSDAADFPEADKLLSLANVLAPERLGPVDVYAEVCSSITLAQSDLLFDYIVAALRPAARRLRQAEVLLGITRTAEGAHHTPSLEIKCAGYRCTFEVLEVPMESLVSFAWLGIRESHQQEICGPHKVLDFGLIGVLAQEDDAWEWRYIDEETDRERRTWNDTPIDRLPPLLPDPMLAVLEVVLQKCVKATAQWRRDWKEFMSKEA